LDDEYALLLNAKSYIFEDVDTLGMRMSLAEPGEFL
jgi:hypothetical protein